MLQAVIDCRSGEIVQVIQEAIESYEVDDTNGKMVPIKHCKNPNEHSIEPDRINWRGDPMSVSFDVIRNPMALHSATTEGCNGWSRDDCPSISPCQKLNWRSCWGEMVSFDQPWVSTTNWCWKASLVCHTVKSVSQQYPYMVQSLAWVDEHWTTCGKRGNKELNKPKL